MHFLNRTCAGAGRDPPSSIILAIDEVAILDTWLGHFDHPERQLDRILTVLYDCPNR